MPGTPVAIDQLPHRVGDDPKIFGHQSRFWKLRLDRFKKVNPGTGHPFVLPGICRVGGDFAIFIEPAEMIDPDDVVEFEAGAEPCQPPGIIGRLVSFPIIERVSPELAVSGEIIRRNARDSARIQIGIHFEQAGMGPDVRAVHCHEDRDIAENLDAARVCVLLQGKPLPEKLKLAPGLGLDFIP